MAYQLHVRADLFIALEDAWISREKLIEILRMDKRAVGDKGDIFCFRM